MTVVYIVDADDSVRAALSRLVDSAGLAAGPCETIDAFIRDAREAEAACALLDVSDLFHCDPKLWLQLQAMAAVIPVIALSVRDDPMTRRIARALGAKAFFRKPVDAAALLDSIDWVARAEGPDGSPPQVVLPDRNEG